MDRDTVLSEWRAFIERLPTQGQMKPFITQSWQRSRDAGVDADPAEIRFRQVPEEELRRRQAARRELIALARPHLAWLSASMTPITHVAYVTDQDGIVLAAEGDASMKAGFGIIPGYDWSEKQMGTNGAGTALAADRPVAVVGPEHYSSVLHDGTCTGAPIHGPDGTTLGAIDLSTSVADGRPERVALVAHVAFAIETQLGRQHAEADRRRTSEFLATLAHELRNPLTALHHAVDLLDHDAAGASDGHDMRQLIRNQLHQMARLIDDLSDAGRADHGKLSLRKERVDLRDIARAALDTSRSQGAQASLALEEALTDEPLLVDGDPARLTQAVVNLLTNACKFTPAGGRVRLTARHERSAAVVRVRDTGIGIAPDKLADIFDFFVQLPGPRNGGAPGLGIGLALVRSLVKMHGGEVSAHSDGEGRGSEFTIRLPLAAADATDAPSDGELQPARTQDGEALRILLVEDSEAVGSIFTELLAALGHEVDWVQDAEQALRRVRDFRPDAIFSDLSLPGMHGSELARLLRKHDDLDGIQLIAITGHDQPADRQRALATGFDHYLVKPVETAELRRLLDALGRTSEGEPGDAVDAAAERPRMG